jgi:hypothetical protein
MSVKFATIKAGDILWECRYERAGNTAMRRWACWPIAVKEIYHAERWALVSWNGNAPRRVHAPYFSSRDIRRNKAEDPRLKRRAPSPSNTEEQSK